MPASTEEQIGPTVEQLIFQQVREGDIKVEFRIVYRGSLPSEGSRSSTKEKQAIRKALHPQLKELWNQHPWMGNASVMASEFSRCGFRFMPVVRKSAAMDCRLDILFLRRDHPGNLVISGGDIDNRIKVLFDGLRIPQVCSEVARTTPDAGEDPFFCLLQDDSLITEVKITTDRLLSPSISKADANDVELTIHVVCNIDVVSMADFGFVQKHALDATLELLRRS